jgi:NAD(P)-dependent dehydrogenase (short-subunit alcohol dehydrogenase family)
VEQIGATRHAARRFHEEGIRCNAVLPGGLFLSYISFSSRMLKNLSAVGTNIGKGMTLETMDQAGYMATL